MLSLVLPTYNEADNLPELLPRLSDVLRDIEHEIIIVDDDSPDQTWAVAQQLVANCPTLRVIRRVGRRGLSSAVIEGFLSARGTVLAVMDADGQHDMSILPSLYAAVADDSHHIAVGSRYTEGGSVGDWDERRYRLSQLATSLALKLCAVPVSDPMSGFFAIKQAAFHDIFTRLNPKGFKILLDILMRAPADIRVTEVPFTFASRLHGESKLSRRVQLEFLEYLYDVTLGRYVPLTFIKYCLVGLLGVFVHLSVLWLAWQWLGPTHTTLTFSTPLLLAIEAAIVVNFWLNNLWTFARAKLTRLAAALGFLKYNVACALGALANYAIYFTLLDHSYTTLISASAGAFVGMVWNYTMARMIWTRE